MKFLYSLLASIILWGTVFGIFEIMVRYDMKMHPEYYWGLPPGNPLGYIALFIGLVLVHAICISLGCWKK